MRENTEVPLKGEDLKAARRIQKIIKEMDKLGHDHHCSAGIHIEHAIRGVRCNGHQDRNNFLETAEELEQFKRNLTFYIKEMEKTIPLVDKALAIFNARYKRCPECKGKGGEELRGGGTFFVEWEDCHECSGYGTVRIPIPSHIPKVQHEQYKRVKEKVLS